jgi:hypothetical protein
MRRTPPGYQGPNRRKRTWFDHLAWQLIDSRYLLAGLILANFVMMAALGVGVTRMNHAVQDVERAQAISEEALALVEFQASERAHLLCTESNRNKDGLEALVNALIAISPDAAPERVDAFVALVSPSYERIECPPEPAFPLPGSTTPQEDP